MLRVLLRRHPLPRHVLLLLPRLPGRVVVLPGAEAWAVAAAGAFDGHGADACLSVSSAAALRSGCDQVVVRRDPWRRLRRAGLAATTYRTRVTATGEHLFAADRRTLALLARATQGPAGRRTRLRTRLRPDGRVVVAAKEAGLPEPLAALHAAMHTTLARSTVSLAVSRDPRRRSALRLHPGPGLEAVAVAKVGTGPAEAGRGEGEQQVLRLLAGAGVRGVPAARGSGRCGDVGWTVESVVPGRPLRSVLAELDRAPALVLLAGVAAWLTRLGVLTTGPAAPGHGLTLPEDLRHLRLPPGLPGVLVHGDLAAGDNVVVDGDGTIGVLDWETATAGGLPLLDLLPAVCTGLALVRGLHTPQEQAAYVSALGSDAVQESPWLRRVVREHCHAVGVPDREIGRVALLAWAHAGGQRARHDALLAAQGLPVAPWTSTAELVLDAWRTEPDTAGTWGSGWT